eukprot:Pgem_evm1s12821
MSQDDLIHLQNIKSQYLSMYPLHLFEWPDSKILQNYEFQGKVVNDIMKCEIIKQYPASKQYHQSFVKKYIYLIENYEKNCEIHEDLLDIQMDILNSGIGRLQFQCGKE